MIITIGGQQGAGKTTIAHMLADKLGYQFYSAGNLKRQMALDKGMTLAEFNKMIANDEFADKEVDAYTKKLGEEKDNLVFDGQLAHYFIPDSFKIFLKATLMERAKRIFEMKREEQKFENVNDTIKAIGDRDEADTLRYEKFHNIKDHLSEKGFDAVIDTSDISQKKVVDKILEILSQKRLI